MGRRTLRTLLAEAQLASRDVERARYGAQRDAALANSAVGALSNAGQQLLGAGGQMLEREDTRELAEAEAFAGTHAGDAPAEGEDYATAAKRILGQYKPPEEGPKEGTASYWADRIVGGPGRRKHAADLAAGKLAPAMQARGDKDAATAAAAAALKAKTDAAAMAEANKMEATLTREISDLDEAETKDSQFDEKMTEEKRSNLAQEEIDRIRAKRGGAGKAPDPLADVKRRKLEAQAKAAEAGAKTAGDKAAEGTTGEQKRRREVASLRSAVKNVDKIIALKANFNTGFLASPLKDIGQSLGIKTKDWTEFKARVGRELNRYIKDTTGASAGVEEMKRLATVMATERLDDEEFTEKIELFREAILQALEEVEAGAPGAEPESDAPTVDAAAEADADYLFQ